MNQPSESQHIRVGVLLGPTAIGKSSFAMRLAQDLDLEILSCDSRQIYRGMDIGTAKPSPQERVAVKHWMIDLVTPAESFSSFRFAKEAADLIRQRHTCGSRILVCGGTGFYYKALSDGLVDGIPSNQQLRDEYHRKLGIDGAESIFHELGSVDPVYASRIHPSNIRRAIRALEVFHTTGQRFSELSESASPPKDIAFSVIILSRERDALYARINSRVDEMVRQGLWEEFESLRSRGFDCQSPGMCTVGYRELFDVEEGKASFAEAIEKVKMNSRRYAKRQITWFTHQVHGTNLPVSTTTYAQLREHLEIFFQEDGVIR